MPSKNPQSRSAQRLLEAARVPNTLSCESAQPLIPDLVAAEAAGETVDDNLEFAALLTHLDHCQSCVIRYVAASETQG